MDRLSIVTKGGLLIVELSYFDSWTLVVNLRRRKWPNRPWWLALRMQSLSKAEGMGEGQGLPEPCLPCSGLLEPLQYYQRKSGLHGKLQLAKLNVSAV